MSQENVEVVRTPVRAEAVEISHARHPYLDFYVLT